MGCEGLHEPLGMLDESALDYHRAMQSLCEELEAVDWYNQRAKATSDASLAAILEHNRDEEKEHAVMLLEWLRRHDAVLDKNLRTYLFTTLALTDIEHAAEAGGSEQTNASPGSLGIGALKNGEQ